MARSRRPYLPGLPFHLTARLQGRSPWFVGAEAVAVKWIGEYASRSECEVLAYAVMPNHLHIVAVQGRRPLGEFMQPLLRRLAVFLHGYHGSEGHVFQRRYHASPCTDPDYLRNAIAYVHLNAVRAHLCARPDEYAWSTHADYCDTAGGHRGKKRLLAPGLELFSPEEGASPAATVSNYLAFLEWRLRTDASVVDHARGRGRRLALQPPTVAGDMYWSERFGSSSAPGAASVSWRRPVMDLRDLAVIVLRRIAPDMSLDVLRSGERTRSLVAIRREFIVRAKENGHRQRAIARFLNVSDVTVSRS